jgi:ketosteroid isomerase-like protein
MKPGSDYGWRHIAARNREAFGFPVPDVFRTKRFPHEVTMRAFAMISLIAIGILSACQKQPKAPDLEAERQAILAADEAWVAAAGRKDFEQTMSYWTDDATMMPPDIAPLKGKDAIGEYIAAGFALPGFAASWKSQEIVIAADGKTAYQFATNEFTASDSAGTLHTVAGKGVVIWRKEPDGAWRAAVDIWNGVGPSSAPSAAGQ